MSIVSDTYTILKDFSKNEKGTTIARKVRVLKVLVCSTIILRRVLSYYNFFDLIPLPALPLFADDFRKGLMRGAIVALIVLVIWPFITNVVIREIYARRNGEDSKSLWLMKAFFAEYFVEGLLVIILLLYSIMTLIDFVNEIYDFPKWAFYVAIVYVAFIIGEKLYYNNLKIWMKTHVSYTHYCDMNGNRIPNDCYVFYNGRRYKVVRDEKYEYYLVDEYSINKSNNRISLDKVASNKEGNLLIDSSSIL